MNALEYDLMTEMERSRGERRFNSRGPLTYFCRCGRVVHTFKEWYMLCHGTPMKLVVSSRGEENVGQRV